MKAKIRRGSGFRGVLDYALSKDEPRIVGGNMSGESARELAKEFAAARQLRPDIEKPVWHCSLSAAPGERLTDQQWSDIAARYMRGMGFSDATQYVVIRHTAHDDQKNPPAPRLTKSGKPKKGGPEVEHIHIVGSRVDLLGKVWLGQNDVHLAIEQTQQIEREFGLLETKGFDGPKAVKALTRGEAGMADRTGEAPREYLQATLAAIVATKPTMGEFIDKAQAAGIELRPNLASTGRMNGFAFGRGGINFTGQQLGASFKWSALSKGIDYQPERDNDFLRELARQPAGAPATAPATAPVATTPSMPPVAARGTAPAPKAKPQPRIQKLGKLPPRLRSAIPKGIAQWARDAIILIEELAKALERFRQQLEQSYWMHQQIQRIERARVAAQARAQIARQTAPKVAPAPAGPARSASQPQANPATAVPTAPSPAPIAGRPAEADPRAAIDAGRREAAERRIRLALQSGKGKSAALVDAVRNDDPGSLDRLIEAGADPTTNRGAALEAAAHAKRDDLFGRLLRGVPLQDHSDLQQLAQRVGPEASAKLRELAKTAKAGGSLEAAGIEQPQPNGPQASGPSAGPKMAGPK